MSHSFRQGMRVEVWSNGQQKWMTDAEVLEVVEAAYQKDGYAYPVGAIKVGYATGEKWLMPEQIPSQVRPSAEGGGGGYGKAAAASADPGGKGYTAGGRTSTVRGPCKMGCGRLVQPGFTRGMKPYDTCCKQCALGRGGHDANCGGGADATHRVCSTVSTGVAPKQWLSSLLEDRSVFQAHMSKIAKGLTTFSAKDVQHITETSLFEPIAMTIQAKDEVVQKWMMAFGGGRDHLRADELHNLCTCILKDRYQLWFPQKLHAKTRMFVRKNPARVDSVYEFGRVLGEGSFGKVYSVKHRVSGEQRVCKQIAKNKGLMEEAEILQEIESMAMLDHPNVIKVYEYFDDSETISQIMEVASGGELQDRIDSVFQKGGEPYTEEFIVDTMKQLLRALAFMHGNRFLHKDLKPQNIMFSDSSLSALKVIDFGLAELFQKDQTVSENFGGTLLYLAPEVFDSKLTMKVDIWSAGVILYNLITGGYPFLAAWPLPPGKDMEWWQGETMRLICEENYKDHERLHNGTVSAECVDLMNKMLAKSLDDRLDAAACLDHAWFRKFEEEPPPLSVGVVQCLSAYTLEPELKQAMFLVIAHMYCPPAVAELRKIFTHFDTGNRGTLNAAVFRMVLIKTGMRPLLADRIIHAIDKDGSGAIEWTEFTAAALCFSVCKKRNLVDAAFALVDTDHDDVVSLADFERFFTHRAAEEDAARWRSRIQAECVALCPDVTEFTKEHFRRYMGKDLKVTPGDELFSVV